MEKRPVELISRLILDSDMCGMETRFVIDWSCSIPAMFRFPEGDLLCKPTWEAVF